MIFNFHFLVYSFVWKVYRIKSWYFLDTMVSILLGKVIGICLHYLFMLNSPLSLLYATWKTIILNPKKYTMNVSTYRLCVIKDIPWVIKKICYVWEKTCSMIKQKIESTQNRGLNQKNMMQVACFQPYLEQI